MKDSECFDTFKVQTQLGIQCRNPHPDFVVLQIRIKNLYDERRIAYLGRELNFRPSNYTDAKHLLHGVLRYFLDIEISMCEAWFKEANQ